MKEKFLRFMQGRYGVDQFSKGLLIAGLVVVLLSSFFAGGRAGSLFYLLGWVFIVISVYFPKIYLNDMRKIRSILQRHTRLGLIFSSRRTVWRKERHIIFINVRGANRRFVFRRGKERLRSDARSVEQHLLRRVDVFTGEKPSVMIGSEC